MRSRHADWWYSRDYQGQLWSDAGGYATAAGRFEDEEHKAVALYKAGDYETSAELFALVGNGAADFNRGLALAKLGRYDEAAAAFDEAAVLDPGLKEMAMENRRGAKRAADSLRAIDRLSVGMVKKLPTAAKEKNGGKDSLMERKPQSEDERLSSDTRVDKLPTSGNRVTDETNSDIHGGKEAKSPSKDSMQKQSSQQASEVLLRQSAADPAEFLHRRFELQVKRYYNGVRQQKQSW